MRLNIACGSNVFPLPWLNTDHVDLEDGTHPEEPKRGYLWHMRRVAERGDDVSTWPEEQRRLVEHIAAGRIRFFQWDLRRGFPMYADGSVDALYGGQMIEHLNPIHEVGPFLAECFRMLRSGGRIRLTTPDLEKLVRQVTELETLDCYQSEQPSYYEGANRYDQLAYIMFGAGGASERYDGHQHLFTPKTLATRLKAAGFCDISVNASSANCVRGGKLVASVFADCIDKGMSHSFAIEAVKP